MKLIEKKFKKVSTGTWNGWVGVNIGGCLCGEVMGEYWGIPDHCQVIWISLHTTPSANRLEMTVKDQGGSAFFDLVETVDGKEVKDPEIWGSSGLDSLLRKYSGKQLHVQVEYME